MKAMKKAMKKARWVQLDLHMQPASIVYDSVVPAGYKPGLHVTIVRAGHRYCECMRGTKLRFFRKHDPAFGEWPMHYLVADELAERFASSRGCEVVSASYASLDAQLLRGVWVNVTECDEGPASAWRHLPH